MRCWAGSTSSTSWTTTGDEVGRRRAAPAAGRRPGEPAAGAQAAPRGAAGAGAAGSSRRESSARRRSTGSASASAPSSRSRCAGSRAAARGADPPAPRRRGAGGSTPARRCARNMRFDGVPFMPVTVRRAEDRPRLVVLADVSLSVRATSRFTLHLVHGLQDLFTPGAHRSPSSRTSPRPPSCSATTASETRVGADLRRRRDRRRRELRLRQRRSASSWPSTPRR